MKMADEIPEKPRERDDPRTVAQSLESLSIEGSVIRNQQREIVAATPVSRPIELYFHYFAGESFCDAMYQELGTQIPQGANAYVQGEYHENENLGRIRCGIPIQFYRIPNEEGN
jgi:hypothetical protein